MSKKDSLTDEELLSLCDFDPERDLYEAKIGSEYIKALSSLKNLVNKNDLPFTEEDILKEPTLEDFSFEGKNDFIYACDLEVQPLTLFKIIPQVEGTENNYKRRNEKIKVTNRQDNMIRVLSSSLGVAYLITCPVDNKEYIIKIGQSRNTFMHRLTSYNCGCVNNWRTASTTNIKLLQSMQVTRKVFKLYLFDCSDEKYVLRNWHGKTSQPFAMPKSLAVEDIMIKEFIKQFKKKPLANIQANATSLEGDDE